MKKMTLFALTLLLLTHAGSASPIRSFDVRIYGATGDAKTKDTAAFQRALDAASTAGGGDVEVPPGEYLIGSIELKSNTTLQLSKDAHLIGSSDMNDYPITKVRWEGRWVDGQDDAQQISRAPARGKVAPRPAPTKLAGQPKYQTGIVWVAENEYSSQGKMKEVELPGVRTDGVGHQPLTLVGRS